MRSFLGQCISIFDLYLYFLGIIVDVLRELQRLGGVQWGGIISASAHLQPILLDVVYRCGLFKHEFCNKKY